MKKGLVLEGGAMRGMFTAGVLDILMENKIEPDGMVGVSAGAAFGCNLKSKQIGRAIRYNVNYAKDWRYCSILSWILTGDLYGGYYDYELLPKKLDIWDAKTFASDPIKFYAVATDANTGRALYHLCSDGGDADLKWIQGSASMPLASKVVSVDGFELLDGGISDSIPLDFLTSIGYDRNIVVLTQPKEYRKVPNSKRMDQILQKGLAKYPHVYQRLEHRYEDYNTRVEEIQQKEEQKEILVIRPKEALNIGSICHDPEEKRRVYELGREAAAEALAEIKSFYEI